MTNIFFGALFFSVWCNILFLEKSVGLSMILFALPLTIFIIHILEKHGKIANPKAKLLLIPISLLSLHYFIFTNHFFYYLNLVIIPILVAIMVLGLFDENLSLHSKTISKIVSLIFTPLSFIAEAYKKARESFGGKFKFKINKEKNNTIKKFFKAMLVTLPLALIVILLLSSADKTFSNLFSNLFNNILSAIKNISLSSIVKRLILITLGFFYLLGFFYYITNKHAKQAEVLQVESKDNFTIKMILFVLNIIYLVFCIIQIQSLFMELGDESYSYYARQGFFQLMIVSVINLVTILIAKKDCYKKEKSRFSLINIMCFVMIIFTFIILISSAYRMYLYENAYGYTLLRLLVYCALFTEGVLLIPTILYVFDIKVSLAKSYFGIVIAIYLCMNFANFDHIIAKRNVDRYVETGKIDVKYLEQAIGPDAIDQILRLLDIETPENADEDVRPEIKNYIDFAYKSLSKNNMDFRDYNISRDFAKYAIERNNN